MKLAAAACIKNEIDIVEPFVRHTLALVDQLVVLDNGSTDGTLDVLHALQDEGLALDVTEDPSIGKYQAERMTRLTRDLAIGRHGADWVFLLDCDEFLGVEKGFPLIPQGADESRPLSIEWHTYAPAETDDQSEINPAVRIRNRRTVDMARYAKMIVPRALAECQIAQGNHYISLGRQRCAATPNPDVYLAHFPMRNLWQYAIRVAITSLQYQTMATRDEANGFHYKDVFELLKNDVQTFNAGFYEAALRYGLPETAREPELFESPFPYRGGPLRYTPRVNGETAAWRALLLYAEQLARQHAVLAAGLSRDEHREMERQAIQIAELHSQLAERRRKLNTLLAVAGVGDRIRKSWIWRLGRRLLNPTAAIGKSEHESEVGRKKAA